MSHCCILNVDLFGAGFGHVEGGVDSEVQARVWWEGLRPGIGRVL
jgi:hypothetical protein